MRGAGRARSFSLPGCFTHDLYFIICLIISALKLGFDGPNKTILHGSTKAREHQIEILSWLDIGEQWGL